jgi:hypothetical protein
LAAEAKHAGRLGSVTRDLLRETEHEVLTPDTDAIAVHQLLRALDGFAIDSNSVAAVEVFEGYVVCLKEDPSVAAGDQRVLDGDFALIAAADVRGSVPQVDLLKVKS